MSVLPCDVACRKVSDDQAGEVCLAFSRGKDCIGALIQLKRYFTKIHLYYLVNFPGLKFIEDDLRRVEDHFKLPVTQFVHYDVFNRITDHDYLPPQLWDALDELDIYRQLNGWDADDEIRRLHGMKPETLNAQGWKLVDDLPTRQALNKLPSRLDPDNRWFFPVADWSSDQLEREIVKEGFALPVDYKLFGRSFEKFTQHRFLGPLKTAYPEDYARVLKFFPLAHLDEFRRTIK